MCGPVRSLYRLLDRVPMLGMVIDTEINKFLGAVNANPAHVPCMQPKNEPFELVLIFFLCFGPHHGCGWKGVLIGMNTGMCGGGMRCVRELGQCC